MAEAQHRPSKGATAAAVAVARRLWRRFQRQGGGLRISYERMDSLAGIKDNTRGTHLNESGDARSIDQYLEGFDLERELQNPVVADNLRFIDTVISPRLPPTTSVVDVGCGMGRYARFLGRAGAPTERWRYTGVELSEEILHYSRRLCPEIEFASSGGGFGIPLPDRSRDLVMASAMLQYACDQWPVSLREMVRVSRAYLFLSRLPVLERHPTTYCHQVVSVGGTTRHHYFALLNRAQLEAALAGLGGRIVVYQPGVEVLPVRGLAEPVVLNLYLIAKS